MCIRDRPCRIYAPVGTHETLLAYLVRRLLENGANSSFVNRVADRRVPVEELIADPVEIVRAMPAPGEPHERISLPRHLFGPERLNSIGMDLSNEDHLSELARGLEESLRIDWAAAPATEDVYKRQIFPLASTSFFSHSVTLFQRLKLDGSIKMKNFSSAQILSPVVTPVYKGHLPVSMALILPFKHHQMMSLKM